MLTPLTKHRWRSILTRVFRYDCGRVTKRKLFHLLRIGSFYVSEDGMDQEVRDDIPHLHIPASRRNLLYRCIGEKILKRAAMSCGLLLWHRETTRGISRCLPIILNLMIRDERSVSMKSDRLGASGLPGRSNDNWGDEGG